jgi:molecular chaperone DnaK (HSP70)
MFMCLIEAPRNRDWIGCIDFGTAMSKAAMVRRKPRTELTNVDVVPLAIGVRDGVGSRNNLLLPSVVYVGDQGLLFGEEAENAAIRGERRGRQAFVSPKQHLSVRNPEDLDEMLDREIDPTGTYTARHLLALFLAYLLVQAGRAAAIAKVPWPVPLRIARPAWDAERAEVGEQALRSLVLRAFAIADDLGDQLSAINGVAHNAAHSALSGVMSDKQFDHPAALPHIFELSDNRSASVLEATAVAAGAIGDTGRRVVVVADIGGGTSDFGAFMTGLPGRGVLGEVDGSSGILRLAGDRLDNLLKFHIFNHARIDPYDAGSRGVVARVRANQRAYKEVLFRTGQVTVELVDDYLTITKEAFLANPDVQAFAQLLRSTFRETLERAIACARENQLNGRRTPVAVLLTGGGRSLPMVKEFITDPPLPWIHLEEASPEIPDGPLDQNFLDVRPQLAVAIGGAVLDLPRQTARVRIQG